MLIESHAWLLEGLAQNSVSPVLQFLAWLLALLQFILALYAVVANAGQQGNLQRGAKYLVGVLFVLAIDTFAIGSLMSASNISQARIPVILLAIGLPAYPVLLLLASISLLRMDLLYPQKSPGQPVGHTAKAKSLLSNVLRWGGMVLVLSPIILTVIDILPGRAEIQIPGLWFSGIDETTGYAGGYLSSQAYLSGILRLLVIIPNFILVNLITLGFLVYQAVAGLLPGQRERSARQVVAWLLLVTFLPGLVVIWMHISLNTEWQAGLTWALLSNLLITLTLAYAIFQRMVELSSAIVTSSLEQAADTQAQGRRGAGVSLQARLVGATTVVVLPLMAAMGLMLIQQAQRQLELNAGQRLAEAQKSMDNQVSLWLDSTITGLQNVANSPAIRSMDSLAQQAILESTAQTYPYFYLISTLDLNGKNLARSDGQPGRDYGNEAWFIRVSASGQPIYQPLAGRDVWKPDLLIAIPIRTEPNGPVAGYLMALSLLDPISDRFQNTRLGQQGFAILVDDQNRLLAHPDWAQEYVQTQYGLQDMNSHPPVAALPAVGDQSPAVNQKPSTDPGTAGMYRFTTDDGSEWQAALGRLENGWGLIVQQRQDELLAPIADFQRIALVVLIASAVMLIPLMLLTVRNSVAPIQKLTETARRVAGGSLDELAPAEVTVEPGEIGLLARTFNTMTTQLRTLIGNLEQRVAERTEAVQRRAIQLQVTAEVAREAASIRDPEELMSNLVNLISERFGFYHAGIFLNQGAMQTTGGTRDSSEGYAVLQAASSEGGKQMLARRHRLKIGPVGSGVGIVGYVAHAGEPRIALDVGADAVFFNNPDLPLTRSEMALPLMVATEQGDSTRKMKRRVIGVLDVQSTQEAAFSQEDIEILQILADQVAVALENARLLSESRIALRQLEQVYGERIRQRWQQRLAKGQGTTEGDNDIAYSFNSARLRPVQELGPSAEEKVMIDDGIDQQDDKVYRITAPIELRGQKLGQLALQRNRPWSKQEVELIYETTDQVALAIENARLLEEIQQRAFQEELVSQMVAETQKSLDLETVLRNMVREVSLAVRAEKIQLQLSGKESTPRKETLEYAQHSSQRSLDPTVNPDGGKDAKEG